MEGRQAVELILAFEKETIVQRLVFDGEGKIAGFVFRPKSMAVLPANKTPESSVSRSEPLRLNRTRDRLEQHLAVRKLGHAQPPGLAGD
jgi:hypothetical protein